VHLLLDGPCRPSLDGPYRSPLDGPCRSHVLAGHLLTVVAGCLLMVLARRLRLSTVDGADDSRSFWRPLYTPAKEQITACCKPLE